MFDFHIYLVFLRVGLLGAYKSASGAQKGGRVIRQKLATQVSRGDNQLTECTRHTRTLEKS